MKHEKTIPTLIGITILSISLVLGLIATNGNPLSFLSKASGDCTPNNLKTTNINHYSLVISLTTPSNCLVNLNFNKQAISDNVKTSSTIHYFEISNLSENTEYSYDVISAGKTYKNNAYKAKTAKKPSAITPISRLAWGKVYYSNQQAAVNSLVYLTIPNAAPISSLVTENGYWYISLATSFNKNLDNWFQPVDNVVESIEVLAPNLTRTTVAGNTSRNNPVPDIIIGQNQSTPPPTSKPLNNDLANVTQVPAQKTFSITSPKESETINTRRPDVFGNASANSIIILNIGQIKDSVQTAADGIWHWYPQTDLSVGLNQLKASLNSETLTRNFIISSDASSLAYTASSSAQIVSPTITPIPTTGLTATKTPSIVPTTKPSTIPTIRAAKPSTSSGVPTTGIALPTIICLMIAFGLIGSSVILTKKD